MEVLNFEISSEKELAVAAKELFEYYPEIKIFLLKGNLGSGKTTFVKFLCCHLGCEDIVSSPTFSLINEYKCGKKLVFHMDLYRLEYPEEAIDIGMDDYIHSGNFCFIEWPDIILPFIKESYVSVILEPTGEFSRKIQCVLHS